MANLVEASRAQGVEVDEHLHVHAAINIYTYIYVYDVYECIYRYKDGADDMG